MDAGFVIVCQLLLGVSFLYVLCKAIHRLFFHPLAKVPGPWYAAISIAYEFWWDCIKDGKYMFAIEDMHREYGPIVRINPWEVHINDPAFLDVLWTNSKLEKDPFYYGGFGTERATVATVTPELHRIRRGAMAQYFSKANVSKLEPRVLSRVQQLCERIEDLRDQDKVIDISNAYRCLATDIVTDYAVPTTRNYLAHSDFNATFNRVLRDVGGIIVWNRHIPILFPIVNSIPRQVVAFFDKEGSSTALVDNQADLFSQAEAIHANTTTEDSPTVLSAVFGHPSLPPVEKSLMRIFDEAIAVIGAGSETTGNTLAVLTYYVIADPTIYQTLRKELTSAATDQGITANEVLPIKVLEPLLYLQATMKEALRMATAVCGRLPRRNPQAAMTYTAPSSGETYILPSKTTISMSIRDIHFNSSIFPDPHRFDPTRWLSGSPSLEKYLVAFGKGVRACLGVELAKQEILLVAGNLFWKYDFELFETTQRDVTTEHDYFAPFGPKDSKGVRVKVCSQQ